jgi:hypothetical protein
MYNQMKFSGLREKHGAAPRFGGNFARGYTPRGVVRGHDRAKPFYH